MYRLITNKTSKHAGKQLIAEKKKKENDSSTSIFYVYQGYIYTNVSPNKFRMNPKNNPIVQEYILPDLSTNRSGRVRQPDDMVETDQILVMNNERFTVPELLFRPDDIGM